MFISSNCLPSRASDDGGWFWPGELMSLLGEWGGVAYSGDIHPRSNRSASLGFIRMLDAAPFEECISSTLGSIWECFLVPPYLLPPVLPPVLLPICWCCWCCSCCCCWWWCCCTM
uniref:(northern house mosquito) hypothetical protein n=1 Tax=Culex pipiens TaxID=7175 RepID=A0A8D8FS20_CULPI